MGREEASPAGRDAFGLPHPDDCPCRVRNKHFGGVPEGATYIGRGSKWGNPFKIGADGDRAAVIAKHEAWLRGQRDLLKSIDELRGRDLVCFCAPQACHGDILLALANADRDARVRWWLDGRPAPARPTAGPEDTVPSAGAAGHPGDRPPVNPGAIQTV